MTTLDEKKSELTQPAFVWASEHQKAFNALKVALTTAPMLGYPDFNREFILETDALLRGLGAVLSQIDENGKVHVIAYANWTLRPCEKSMHNYSSAKLELLALKRAVTEKLWTICLGWSLLFTQIMTPWQYVQTCKLSASQICWLSKLALFDFNIIYRLSKTNQGTDALSQCPELNCKWESDSDSDDPVVLSYATICKIIELVLGDIKIPFKIKREAQADSNLLEGEKNVPQVYAVPNLTVLTSAVSVFNQVPPATMAKAQSKVSVLGLVIPFMHKAVKPKGFVISKIRCRTAQMNLLQFDHLVLKQHVLHQIYVINDDTPIGTPLKIAWKLWLCMLHDDYGH